MNKEAMVAEGLERCVEAARFLGISRTKIYQLMRDGLLPYVQLGKSRRIPIAAVRAYAATNLKNAR